MREAADGRRKRRGRRRKGEEAFPAELQPQPEPERTQMSFFPTPHRRIGDERHNRKLGGGSRAHRRGGGMAEQRCGEEVSPRKGLGRGEENELSKSTEWPRGAGGHRGDGQQVGRKNGVVQRSRG